MDRPCGSPINNGNIVKRLNIDLISSNKVFGDFDGTKSRTLLAHPRILPATKKQVEGRLDMDHVSTSYAERQNLNIRMKNRHFTRLTNTFSKKAENLAWSIVLDFFHYNFVRNHQTLKMSPAMKTGIVEYPIKIEDIVEMLPLPVASKRGKYKPRKIKP